jgi:hypothetical protein
MFAKTINAAVLFALAASLPATAGIVQTLQPDAAYLSNTNLLAITDPVDSNIDEVSDGNVTASFSHTLAVSGIGSGWATWGSPPDTELSTPLVLRHPSYDSSATSLVLSFSKGLTTFGLEAEPDPFDLRNITMDFYNGVVLLGSITRSINGSAGARLLAGTTDNNQFITSVVVSSDVDFAIAQLRYDEAGAVPEPASMGLMASGFGALMFWARRRKQ